MPCEHNAEFLNVKLVVHKLSLRLSSQTVTPKCRLHSATHLQAELSPASSQQRPEISKVILIDIFVEEADQSGVQMPRQLAYKLNNN
jgi:hypothetical protein